MNWLVAIFAMTFAAAAGATFVVRRAALRFGAVDRPDGHRKRHAAPTPRWGGVAVYLAVVLGIVAAGVDRFGVDEHYTELAMLLTVAAGIVCFCGAIDDLRPLSSRAKLVLQIAAVMPLIIFGYWIEKITAFGVPIYLGWMGVPLTIFWLLGCINSLNLLDGMDGLASLVGALTAAMIAIVAHSLGHDHVSVIGLILAAALGGFLLHNMPPARIFLGDSGSMVIGLTLGVLGLQGALKTSTTLAITIPAVIMSLPFFDTLLAVVRRKLSGRSFAAADREHIHHRLLDRGMTPWQVLCLLGALCLLTGGAATAATIFRNESVAWITALALLVLVVRLRLFGHHELTLVRGWLSRRFGELRRAAGASISRRTGWPARSVLRVENALPREDAVPAEGRVATDGLSSAAPSTVSQWPSKVPAAVPGAVDVRLTQAAALAARRETADVAETQPMTSLEPVAVDESAVAAWAGAVAGPAAACGGAESVADERQSRFAQLIDKVIGLGVFRIECDVCGPSGWTRYGWTAPEPRLAAPGWTWQLCVNGPSEVRCEIALEGSAAGVPAEDSGRAVGAAVGAFVQELMGTFAADKLLPLPAPSREVHAQRAA